MKAFKVAVGILEVIDGVLIALLLIPTVPVILLIAFFAAAFRELETGWVYHQRRKQRLRILRAYNGCPLELSCELMAGCKPQECPNFSACARAVLW